MPTDQAEHFVVTTKMLPEMNDLIRYISENYMIYFFRSGGQIESEN